MKVMKKIITAALTVALAVVTMLGMTPTSTVSADTTTETHRAVINISKYLGGSRGLLPATDTFSWTITPIGYQRASTSQANIAPTAMPQIGSNAISVAGKGTTSVSTTATGVSTATITGGSADLSGNSNRDYEGKVYFDFAEDQPIGVYTYHIKENAPGDDDGVSYDIDGYYINIYVVNMVDANGVIETPHITTIANITAWKDVNTTNNDGNKSDVADSDEGSPNNNVSGNEEPGKDVNSETPTYGGTDALIGKTAITTQVSTVEGQNAIELTSPYENGFATYDLTVGKNVVGNYASTDDVFEYNVIIEDSALPSDTKLKIGYSDSSDTSYDNPTVIGLGGSGTTIKLKHGEHFEIKGLTSLASYSVTEKSNSNYYTPAAVVTAGHGGAATVQDNSAELGESEELSYTEALNLTTTPSYNVPILGTNQIDTTHEDEDLTVSGKIKIDHDVKVASTGNIVKTAGTIEDVTIMYTNFKDYVTPTGMLMNVLPYAVGVIAVAAVAVVVVMKKRKEGYAESSNSQGL